MPIHPKCNKEFPDGTRAGHCATCCETFIGNTAFEAHRVGQFPDGRRCEIQPYENGTTESGVPKYGHWQDEKDYWHYGKQLTQAEKDKLFKRS
ncbi:FDXHR family putative zinc-binding protein [Glutamicibacter sp. AOP5-A2-18]|uniref:FDXHR family putative zinc-binding protein n=1 Tax=Glutamicibacter sp. AOP5-A2-18 TaxID=3457656 RepID=UPI004034659D